MEDVKVLITVKTYPIPSAKYDELVCTAGVTESGDFVRLYPINFRDLPFSQQYKKYQWIRVRARKHIGWDPRKESYRPDCSTLEILGECVPANPGNWSERAKYALKKSAASIEDLQERQAVDGTSLGVFRPKRVHDLVVSPDAAEWPPKFLQELRQARIWESRSVTKEPPRKVPLKFQYRFDCSDPRCTGHQMMIEDWEVGALYWNLIDRGATPVQAAEKVRDKFLTRICSPENDTHFFVGTILAHPRSWVVVGLFYPKKKPQVHGKQVNPRLFD